MKRDREEVKSEAARAIVRGSEITPPRGRRCSRCQRIIKPEDDNGHELPFCSSDCSESLRVETSDKRLRALVLERDRGVCSACSLDCLALREELDALKESSLNRGDSRPWYARLHQLVLLGFDRDAVTSGAALWEADHDPPRVLGGTNTLNGIKTKCLACHKGATKKLARGRADARRPRRRFGR